MNTSLKYLSSLQQTQLEEAKKIIVEAIRPEKIILFGIFSSEEGAAGLNDPIWVGKLPPAMRAFDLLVVTREGDRRSDYELQDILENRCRGLVRVTILVHDIGYINKRIAQGHYFFAMVRREAILLYDAGRVKLEEPGPADLEKIRLTALQDFERWRRQAWAFFRSAEFNVRQEEWKLAIFLLHQATEHMYQAILLSFMGYKPTTHNLDKLRRYTNRFSIGLASLFPRDTKEEDRLFQLLLAGYVDARYKEGFAIDADDVRVLTARVLQLLEIGERICRNRLTSLEKREMLSP